MKRLILLKNELKKWNVEVFGDIGIKKREVIQEINNIDNWRIGVWLIWSCFESVRNLRKKEAWKMKLNEIKRIQILACSLWCYWEEEEFIRVGKGAWEHSELIRMIL